MSVNDWILRHSDAWHPGTRESCSHCQEMIAEFGEMPSPEAIQAAAAVHAALRQGKDYISPSLRWEVWERDNFTCQDCGTRRHLSVDHIVAESNGGTLDLANLRTLCIRCNCKKGAK